MFLQDYRRWNAKWIWPKNGRVPNTHALFRRDFTLDALPTAATMFLAVETFARAYLNGRPIFRSMSLSYPGQQHYEEVDLLPFLKTGTNQLAVVAWYAGIGTTASWLKDPGLLCEFELVTPGGTNSIGSDATWVVRKLDAWTGEIRSPYFNLDVTEYLDYRRLPKDFPFSDASADNGFEPPQVSRWPGVRMGVVEPRPFPAPVPAGDAPLKLLDAAVVPDRSEMSTVPALVVSNEDLLTPLELPNIPATIPPPPEGHAVALVYHLGGYCKGYPQVVVDAPAGTIVDLSWSEGLVDRHFDARGGHPFTTDRYTLREGPNTISPEEWKAGRYLQLTFRNFRHPIAIRELRFARELYPMPRRTRFASSDERLNKIVEIGLRSTDMCMHDRIMDCPWRERRQWSSDFQRIALVNHYAFGDRGLVRGVLRQHARLQDPTGRVWVCMPLMEEYPCQAMDWTRAIVEYGHYTGDSSLREELTDNIEWLHRWFLRCRDKTGLFFNNHPPVLNWMDNPLNELLKVQDQSAFLATNLRYLVFLDDVAQMLDLAGHAAEAQRAREERRDLAARIPAAFVDRSSGLLRECSNADLPLVFSELGAARAVLADLPGFDAAAHWDRYQARVRSHPDQTRACSPFGKHETFEALAKLGRPGEIVRELYQYWGPMVDAGSDTAWETFAGSSVCHGWSGIPLVALMRHVLQVDPRRPGVTRKENVAGLAWIECEIPGV